MSRIMIRKNITSFIRKIVRYFTVVKIALTFRHDFISKHWHVDSETQFRLIRVIGVCFRGAENIRYFYNTLFNIQETVSRWCKLLIITYNFLKLTIAL